MRDPYINKNYLEEYLEIVESDPQKHILNRNLNYHPSILHKSIREDDIDTFQSLLYKNNIDVNYSIENSYYERAKTIDDTMSLIQITSIYGSLKIFKFLLNNEKIFIDDNLLCYAYCGYNFDIIHLCETKCSFDSVYLQPIALHQYNLLDYFIENFSDKIIKTNDKIKNVLKNFVEDENNAYQTYLNNSSIEMAFYSVNFTVVLSCLEKIVFIARNQKNVEFSDEKMSYIIFVDFDLFKFIYSQRHSNVNKLKCKCYFSILDECINEFKNDVFKFVLDDLKEKVDFIVIFRKCLNYNHDMANYILDLQIDEKKSPNKTGFIFEKMMNKISMNELMTAVRFYNEEIVVKMIRLYDFFNDNENISIFIIKLMKTISTKMMISLLKELSFFPKDKTMIMIIISMIMIQIPTSFQK